jgi:hypothetical protein
MQTNTPARFGSFARANMMEKINAFAEKYGVSRAALTEALVAGFLETNTSEASIRAIIQAGIDYINANKVDGRRTRGTLMSELRGLTNEQLEAVMKQIRADKAAGGSDAPLMSRQLAADRA